MKDNQFSKKIFYNMQLNTYSIYYLWIERSKFRAGLSNHLVIQPNLNSVCVPKDPHNCLEIALCSRHMIFYFIFKYFLLVYSGDTKLLFYFHDQVDTFLSLKTIPFCCRYLFLRFSLSLAVGHFLCVQVGTFKIFKNTIIPLI